MAAEVDDVEHLVRAAYALVRRLQAHYLARLGELGITRAEAGVLLELPTGVGLLMRELADSLHVDRSNLTGLVQRLEARGLVERAGDPADRRARVVRLTTEGAAFVGRLRSRLAEGNPIVAGLDPAEVRTLRGLLDRLEPG